jgi:hypothetical protein
MEITKEAEVIINFHILLLFEKVMIVKQICFEFDALMAIKNLTSLF